jgi:hypothetical protein
MRKVTILMGSTVALILLTISAASAGPPTITTFHDEFTDIPVEDCGSFMVLLTFSHDQTITTFYDKTGTPIRENVRFSFSGTFTNSVTGKRATENGVYTVIVDLVSGEANVVGLVLLIHMEGQGVVVLELGHVTFDQGTITRVNSPQILDAGSLVCAILA